MVGQETNEILDIRLKTVKRNFFYKSALSSYKDKNYLYYYVL
jgi:hypothetical protein